MKVWCWPLRHELCRATQVGGTLKERPHLHLRRDAPLPLWLFAILHTSLRLETGLGDSACQFVL